jgi:hypothetical protein
MPTDSHMAELWDVAVKVNRIEIGLQCGRGPAGLGWSHNNHPALIRPSLMGSGSDWRSAVRS